MAITKGAKSQVEELVLYRCGIKKNTYAPIKVQVLAWPTETMPWFIGFVSPLQIAHATFVYSCPKCKFWFQLKSQKSRIGDSITDGAYAAMMNAIHHDEMPSFYFMQYDLVTWSVRNLLLVPSFAFPPSAIIKRKPLSSTARRAGWVGCNFALNRIPVEARFAVVTEKEIVPETEVREKFKRVKPLKDIPIQMRGWTLDVLNIVRRLVSEGRASRVPNSEKMGRRGTPPSDSFTTAEVYAFERELEQLHPDNRHVRDKIRQQLQVLRDLGFLLHIER